MNPSSSLFKARFLFQLCIFLQTKQHFVPLYKDAFHIRPATCYMLFSPIVFCFVFSIYALRSCSKALFPYIKSRILSIRYDSATAKCLVANRTGHNWFKDSWIHTADSIEEYGVWFMKMGQFQSNENQVLRESGRIFWPLLVHTQGAWLKTMCTIFVYTCNLAWFRTKNTGNLSDNCDL